MNSMSDNTTIAAMLVVIGFGMYGAGIFQGWRHDRYTQAYVLLGVGGLCFWAAMGLVLPELLA